ncbi:MAG TPA: nucleotidyltransferase family protein [Acidobacteriaceae bacterium]|nr:nucleotidyltransferase family protein [Acidobacteriaceae bacterium]
MHRPLADTILATFHLPPAENPGARLASFSTDAWAATYRWLDASGLAVYFLDRVKTLGLETSLPATVLQRLERNLSDNRERTADNFAELARINRALTASGITFVNLKGISLVPHACADPALRLQFDLDLLIEMRQIQSCAVTLAALNYVLTAVSGSVWEFKAGASTLPSVDDLYKPKPQRCVEIHFAPSQAAPELAARREWSTWQEFSFPVLSEPERFTAQAAHVLKHMRGEWIRLSWLLEFRHSVLHWKDDRAFWQQVREQAAADRELQTAIGAAIALTTIAFGSFAPEELTAWAVDALDPRLQLWLDRYGRQSIMADFPGTKLYLLQPDASPATGAAQRRAKRHRLLPLHNAPRIVYGAAGPGIAPRLRGWSAQMSFFLFRLRFHFVEGWRYLLEAPRWKKIVATAQQPRPPLVAADERGLL